MFYMTTFIHSNLAFGTPFTKWPTSNIEALHLGQLLDYDHFHAIEPCIWDHFYNMITFTDWNLAFGTIFKVDHLHTLKLWLCDHFLQYEHLCEMNPCNITAFSHCFIAFGTTLTIWPLSHIETMYLGPFYTISTFTHC